MNLILSILGILIVLPPIIIIHELGHLLIARLNGVHVERFSIGFGSDKYALIKWTDKYGTIWKITPFLLGGFATMAGQYDDPNEQAKFNKKAKKMSDKEKSGNFMFKNRLQKSSIIFAGPFANILFTITILFALFAISGQTQIAPIIGGVAENSAAHKVGLKTNDKVISINENKIETFLDIIRITELSNGKELNLTIERPNENKTENIKVTLTPTKIGDSFKLGIYSSQKHSDFKKLSILQSAKESVKTTYNLTTDFFKSLYQLITGQRSSKEVGGLIAIADMSGKALSSSIYSIFYLMAMLSLIVGIMNLLPIPVLDGGHLFIYGIESIIRRDIPDKIKIKMFLGGWVLIGLLMVFATYNDISRLLTSNTETHNHTKQIKDAKNK